MGVFSQIPRASEQEICAGASDPLRSLRAAIAPQISKTITAPTTAPTSLQRFAGTVPPQGLAQPRGDERTDNPKDGCEDKAEGFVAARRNKLCDHSCDETG